MDGHAASRDSTVTVRAAWDAEAAVWWARSEDLPGLVSESPTLEGLIERVSAVVPDLLAGRSDSGLDSTRITLLFHADRAVTLAA